VLLPDHIHCIWTLPENDCDYSKRWGMIKAGFSKRAKHLFHRNEWMSDSKRKHREAAVWQRRFWEHMIRDEDDFRRHLDYLHFNPVKHGLVKCVRDWPHSTFHRFVKDGFYPQDWGIIYGFPGREISVNISRIPDLPTPKSPPGRGLRGGFPPKMGLSNLYRLLL
jgi:putative transposase